MIRKTNPNRASYYYFYFSGHIVEGWALRSGR